MFGVGFPLVNCKFIRLLRCSVRTSAVLAACGSSVYGRASGAKGVAPSFAKIRVGGIIRGQHFKSSKRMTASTMRP